MIPLTSACALLLAAATASAPAAYITDRLVVGLLPEPGPGGPPLRLLSSGTPLEVLQEKDGYTQVQLADDTRGWVASSYVTGDKPAQAVLAETQARLRQMGLALAALREQQAAAADAGGRTAPVDASLPQAETRVAQLEAELADNGRANPAPADGAGSTAARLLDLQARVDQAVQLLGGEQGSAAARAPSAGGGLAGYRDWLIGSLAALLGFIAGGVFFDYLYRRRHGGFRI